MIINNDDLRGTNYRIVKTFEKEKLSFSEVINDMMNNEYSRLENYYKDKFYFIKFKDEEVIVEDNNKNILTAFGKNGDGFFVINKSDEIWLIPFASSNYDKPIFINSSLHQFICCYCLLLSILFYFCTKIIDKKTSKKIAIKFKKDIKNIDELSTKSLFYQNYIFSIENLELPIHFVPMDYIRSERHINTV